MGAQPGGQVPKIDGQQIHTHPALVLGMFTQPMANALICCVSGKGVLVAAQNFVMTAMLRSSGHVSVQIVK
jgi:hypothetical protein